jgi:thiol-disulfide isomerase/thioredoxin
VKRLLLLAALLLVASTQAALPTPSAAAEATAEQPTVTITFFWGDGCPYCALEEEFLERLVQRYPQVVVDAHEVWYDEAGRNLFMRVAAAHGVEPQGVPATFVAGRAWIGFNEAIGREIEAVVLAELRRLDATPTAAATPSAPSALPASPTAPSQPPDPSPEPSSAATVDIPIVGPVDLAGQSLFFSTALIAAVDGFNPCSLWVLSVLLAMMLHSGSRRRILAVGVTFLFVSALAYGAFMVGLFNVIGLIGYLWWVQLLIAAIVLVFAVVAIKDYFWFGRGISFVIPDRHKPAIYRRSRALLSPERSLLAVLGGTVVLAAGVSYLELPCTAGLPVLWSGLVADAGLTVSEFALHLGLYLAIFMLDELLLLGGVLVTLRATRMDERHGRVLKLVAGSVMLALALTMLLAPETLNQLGGTLLVFGVALAAAGVTVIVHRLLLPRLGIRVGSGA